MVTHWTKSHGLQPGMKDTNRKYCFFVQLKKKKMWLKKFNLAGQDNN